MLLHKDLSLANDLIAMLPPLMRGGFLAHSDMVELQRGEVLVEAGRMSDDAYFPVDSVVSLMLHVSNASAVAIGLVGHEGMLSSSLILGAGVAAFTGVVQGTGRAWRIERHELQHLMRQDSCLREVLYRYAGICMNQVSLQTACLRYHTVQERLARWLLMTRDRSQSNELFLTHAALALVLGVTRESVTRAASSLQNHGLISYGRGYVMLLDVQALQGTACACYDADRAAYTNAFTPRPEVCRLDVPQPNRRAAGQAPLSRSY